MCETTLKKAILAVMYDSDVEKWMKILTYQECDPTFKKIVGKNSGREGESEAKSRAGQCGGKRWDFVIAWESPARIKRVHRLVCCIRVPHHKLKEYSRCEIWQLSWKTGHAQIFCLAQNIYSKLSECAEWPNKVARVRVWWAKCY